MSDTSFDPRQGGNLHEQLASNASFPTMRSLTLSDDDLDLIARIEKQPACSPDDLLADTFYRGEEIIRDLGIAIPAEISDKLFSLVGWPKQAVDPYVDRWAVDGFRLAGATDSDEDLRADWVANNMDAQQSMLFTDNLSLGRGILSVGTNPDGKDEAPVVAVEDPKTMRILWDVRGRTAKGGLQGYQLDDQDYTALYTPDHTLHMLQEDDGTWELVHRDDHGFGWVPLLRVPNNVRSSNRNGQSEIGPELRSLVMDACHALLGLKVAGQIYSVPRLLLLGATEAAFQRQDGSTASLWETYINLILTLERDEDGEVPDVKQLQVYDPATYTKVVEMYAAQAAGLTMAPPQDFGLYTDGNPISQESWAASEGRRDRRARRKTREMGAHLADLMRMVQRFRHGGELPDKFKYIETDWHPVEIPTPGITTDAITKQITAQVIPARSDVTLKKLGYSALERRRLEQDWKDEERRVSSQGIVAALEGAAAPPQATQEPQEPANAPVSG